MRKIAAGLVLIGMVMASAPVQAGGWAVLTLDAWPDRVTTNKSFTIGFVLRQHGQTLLGGQSGTVFFEKGRQQVQFKVVEAGSVGHYTATVTLPQTGAWQWRITIFGEHEMPALMVQDAAIVVAAARAITPIQQAALGKIFFVAKGCYQCHYHEGVADSGNFTNAYGAYGAPNLSMPKFTSEYLHLWLKNPEAVKMGTQMPNLNLKPAEIDALAAFLTQRTNP